MEPIADEHPHEFTSVQISGNISGLISSNTTILDVFDTDVYCTGVYGRVGVPIDIESEGYFESMTLTIEYDENSLGEIDENNLGVLWYDEETGSFVEQEQALVDATNDMIIVDLCHFSTYIVVDLALWNNPILPDYSNYSIIASNSEEYWSWGSTIPSLNDREIGCFNWWKLSQPFHNYEIVETLSSNLYCDDPDAALRVWHYEYSWLVMDMTDADEDGIPDVFEVQGIIGMDGNTYCSNPNTNDSDGDMIFDGDEFGNLYVIHRFDDGTLQITLNGVVVYGSADGSIPPDSPYYYFVRFTNGLNCGQSICVASLISDPMNKDTDGDGFSDDLDARPKTDNTDIVYILSNVRLKDESLFSFNLYRESGLECRLLFFSDYESLSIAWNGIGLFDAYYDSGNKPFGDKYYYNVTNVVIHAHGTVSSMDLGGYFCKDRSQVLLSKSYVINEGLDPEDYYTTDDLCNKTIESLFLSSCLTGGIASGFRNMAYDFLDNHEGIQQVIAPDTTLTIINNHYLIIGYADTDIYIYNDYDEDDNNNCEYYEAFRSTLEDNSYSGMAFVVDHITGRKNACGLLIFSRSCEPYDLFSNDVYFGYLHIPSDNYHLESEGIIAFSVSEEQRLTDYLNGICYNDPVLGY